ncbi:MAG: hypothetical protein WCT12_04925 [Verrucomicrobiota bacterium]
MNQQQHSWSTHSDTGNDGRRVITLRQTPSRDNDQPPQAGTPAHRRRKVIVQFASEDMSTVPVPVRVYSPTERLVSYQPKLQLLNAW